MTTKMAVAIVRFNPALDKYILVYPDVVDSQKNVAWFVHNEYQLHFEALTTLRDATRPLDYAELYQFAQGWTAKAALLTEFPLPTD